MNLTALLAIVLFIGCVGRHELTILHTNDIHGRFAAERAHWRSDSAAVGGFGALSGALDSLRNVDEHVIYVDAGDVMTGNPICNLTVDGVKGGALLEFLRLCHCDVGCLGNHEFDLGADHARRFAKNSKVEFLCANLLEDSTNTPLCFEYKILRRGKLRIGVIGLLLNDLAGVTSKQALAPFTVLDIAATAQSTIDRIDDQSDLIILLTHNGLDEDIELARNVSGCDIIIGGHSHTRLQEPLIENGVIIVQAGSYLKELGVLKVSVSKDRVTSHQGTLIELVADRFSPDSAVAALVSRYALEIEHEYGQVIAEAGMALERRYSESSPLGNLICDLMREHYRTDFAFTNSGGLRKDISQGNIRKLDCVELMPFVNSVALFSATGAELLRFAERQANAQQSGKSEILQMSGIEISYDVQDGTISQLEVSINGNSVEADAVYRGVSIDYVLIAQPEKYLGFTPQDVEGTGILFSDFLIQAFSEAAQPLMAVDEPRLTQRKR